MPASGSRSGRQPALRTRWPETPGAEVYAESGTAGDPSSDGAEVRERIIAAAMRCVDQVGAAKTGLAKVLTENGLRLLLVGYESGSQQILINIKKGLWGERARRFDANCRDLGINVHGTFILGLPGEMKETIAETIAFAREVNPHTLQVSVAVPYPGTELYRQAQQNGWLVRHPNAVGRQLREGRELAQFLGRGTRAG